jgi:hypothetical protein
MFKGRDHLKHLGVEEMLMTTMMVAAIINGKAPCNERVKWACS